MVEVAQRSIILDQENGFTATLKRRRMAHCFLGAVRPGQVDLERRSMSHFAVHPNMAPTLFHNAVYRREPEASPAIFFLRREKWFKDVLLDFRIHSRSGIGEGQQH